MQNVIEDVTNNKKNIKKAIHLFIAVMLFLTFFSSTINNFMLPRAKIVYPLSGALTKEVQADGIVEGKEVYKAYVQDSYKVQDVKVQTGEAVSKGQLLMVLDTTDLERELYNEQTILAQKEITLAILGAEKERAIAAAQDDLDLKQKNAAISKKLYEMGAEAEVDLEKTQAELRAAQRTYEAALGRADQSRGGPNLDIKKAELDIQLQEGKITALQDELKTVSNVVAPDDGIITQINCPEGSLSDPSKPLYALTSRQGGFELKTTIDITKADFLVPGDEVEVSIPSLKEGLLKGKIRSIGVRKSSQPSQNDHEQKEVLIDIESSTLRGGEHAEIHIRKETKSYNLLIPNEAVRYENHKYYVFTMREKNGALGKEYYIQKVNIFCQDSDDSQTAVSKGLFGFEKVVCSSNKIISEGDRVKPAIDDK